MRYVPLPIELQLNEAEDDERPRIVARYYRSLAASEGFDLVKLILREVEADAYRYFKETSSTAAAEHYMAKVRVVEEIRSRFNDAAGSVQDLAELEAEEDF